MSDIDILIADSNQEFADGAELFKEYARAINFDAGFRNFDTELTSLKTRYASPDGCLLLAYKNDQVVGCVAVAKMSQGLAELKRFYVKTDFRQFKIGARLLEAAIENAKQLGFHHLRLEVIPTLTRAKELYSSFGFYPIDPYQVVHMEGTTYMEKSLSTEPINPWNEVPLADYEKHMSHQTVGQLEILSTLTKRYFGDIKPNSCIILGVAGGNGLEHIDPLVTNRIVGIDINQHYLDATFSRHSARLNGLEILNRDIAKNSESIGRTQLIWAGLIVEYIGIDNCFVFAHNNLLPGGHLIVTIQSNRQALSISPTGIDSVKKIGQIFQPVNVAELLSRAEQLGFKLAATEENELPNGKSFLTFHFRL